MKEQPSPPTVEEEIVRYLKEAGEILEFAAEVPIIRRGEPGRAFFVVLAGCVEVRLVGEGGKALPLRRLGAGAFFGEMSILTGDPISADVIAVEPATLLSYPAALFPVAMGECAPLRDRVVASMASNLRGSSTDVWNLNQRAEALNVLLDTGAKSGPIVARSRKMRAVEEEISRLSQGDEPLLIRGDPGTGKLFAAAKIHQGANRPDAPFIVVDCRDLAEGEAQGALVGTSRFGSPSGAAVDFDSLHRYGALHLANRGTLVLRHIEALAMPAQRAVAEYLDGLQGGSIQFPEVRIIATSHLGAASAEPPRLHPGLAEHLARGVLALPPLRERRQDILPLAQRFLEEGKGDQTPTLSTGAEHVLVSRRYQHGNAAELREAVELAALFAGGGEILAEHIFTGPKEEGTPLEYDLGQIGLIRWLISDRILGAIRWTVLGVFSAIIAACLFAGGTAVGRFANGLIWGLWWPGLIIIFLFVGRLWCAVCPLSTAAQLARRWTHLDRPPAGWLKKHSTWLIVVGFVGIVWVEHVFHMTRAPAAAGTLLLSLAAAAAIFGWIYQREAWCRYLCPMGNLGAAFSLSATVSVRANPSVCATCCSTHECHKGSATQAGCPVFHHPLYARDGHVCKLCFNCLKSCPHDSAKLYLRPPLLRLWRQADVGTALSLFALVVFFISPLMLAAQTFGWLANPWGFTLAAAAAVALAFAFKAWLPRMLSPELDLDPAAGSRVAFTLLLLAWGPATSFHLANSPAINSLALRSTEGSLWHVLLPGGEIPLLQVLQLGAVTLAVALTAIALWGIRRWFATAQVRPSPTGWKLLLGVCVLYTTGVLLLVLRQVGAA